jgi:hypothetical protein
LSITTDNKITVQPSTYSTVGEYSASLKIDDFYGGITTYPFILKVTNDAPDYLDPANPFADLYIPLDATVIKSLPTYADPEGLSA